jgi:hypothetical protein
VDVRTILVAAALLSAISFAGCGSGDPGAAGGSTSAADERPPPTVPVLDPAQLYEADGLVLDDVDGPKLCVGGVADSLPPQCFGVPLVGWDWDAVEGEESASETTWGNAHVVGTYDGEAFTVAAAGPYETGEADFGERDFSTPCPEPAGGWVAVEPSRISEADFDAGAAAARARPDHVALWVDYVGDDTPDELAQRLSEGETVLQIMNVVVTDDVAGAEAAIREVWGGPVCVTQREGHTEEELAAIRAEAERFVQEDLGLRFTWSSDGGLGLAAEIGVVVDPGGAGQVALDARYGSGMVKLFPALRPVE